MCAGYRNINITIAIELIFNRDKQLIAAIKDFKDELMGRGSGVCTKEDVEWYHFDFIFHVGCTN